MSENIVCWKCGVHLVELILPMSRREECPSCAADQHVCRLCRHYNERVAGRCQEDRAEEVFDKESANFCDYFEPKAGAFREKVPVADSEARAQLAELFGDEPPPEEESSAMSEEDIARAELEKLFGGSDQQD